MDRTQADSVDTAENRSAGFKTPKSTSQVVETGRHAGVDEPGDAQGPGDAGRYESTAEARAALKERANDENPRTPEEMVEATKNT